MACCNKTYKGSSGGLAPSNVFLITVVESTTKGQILMLVQRYRASVRIRPTITYQLNYVSSNVFTEQEIEDLLMTPSEPRINLVNIIMFAQAHVFQWLDQRGRLPKFITEQIEYRVAQCIDCVTQGSCMSCGCKVPAKLYQLIGCKSERWGRLLWPHEWKRFQKERNLDGRSST